MHLLKIDKENYIGQADPFILESRGRFYIYTTGDDGIYAYSAFSASGNSRVWYLHIPMLRISGRRA